MTPRKRTSSRHTKQPSFFRRYLFKKRKNFKEERSSSVKKSRAVVSFEKISKQGGESRKSKSDSFFGALNKRFFSKKKRSSSRRKSSDTKLKDSMLFGVGELEVTEKLVSRDPQKLSQEKRSEFVEKREKKEAKKEREKRSMKSQDVGGRGKLYRTFNRICFKLYLVDTLYDPWLKGGESFRETDRSSGKIRSLVSWAPYLLNSTVTYILAYIMIYLLYQLAVIFVAGAFSIDSVLFYYEVMFPMGDFSKLWTPSNIIAITLAGPIISVLVALVLYFVVVLKRKLKNQQLRLLVIWLAFHGFNMFLGAWVAGIITGQGFGYVAGWLFMSTSVKLSIALVLLFVFAAIGWKSTQPFLETSNSLSRVRKVNRSFFILYQGVLPWAIGTGLLLLIKIPNAPPQHDGITIYDSILLFSILFSIVPMFFNTKVKPHVFVDPRKRRKTRLNVVYFIVAILAIVIFRFGLSNGLHFLIRWSFVISPW